MESGTLEREPTEAPALSAPTLCAAFQATAEAYADRVALRRAGGTVSISWRDYAEAVRRLAGGLAVMGLERGDTLALMLMNRPEFHLADAAAMHLGAVPFSIYETSPAEQIEYLIENAGSRIVVTERAFLDRVFAVKNAHSEIEHVVVVDGGLPGTMSLEDIEALCPDDFDFDAAWQAIEPDDVLTLIYTSGTTGPPKGVELTHGNLMAGWRAFNEVCPVAPAGRLVSYLPSAHIADRWSSHYGPMVFGATVTCCPEPREVIGVLPEVRPTIWGGVPRVWEKLKAALEAAIDAEPDDERRAAVRGALEVGRRRVQALRAGGGLPAELEQEWLRADELVCSRIRERLGLDRCDRFIVGAAPMPVEALEFFAALGIDIVELWGMSETSAVATINPPEDIRIGTVGKPLPGVELRLASDGEVLVRGPVNMAGYRGDPELTAETVDPDGWLRTGDVGELDEDGYLTIVDRKKELIISAGGKNMSPANIEARIKAASPLVGEAIAIGDSRPYNVALIVLDPDGSAVFAHTHGLADASPGAMGREPAVHAAIAAAVDEANSHLARAEQIKKFTVLQRDWEAGGDELTPTMKLKRKPIEAKYAEEIEALYAA